MKTSGSFITWCGKRRPRLHTLSTRVSRAERAWQSACLSHCTHSCPAYVVFADDRERFQQWADDLDVRMAFRQARSGILEQRLHGVLNLRRLSALAQRISEGGGPEKERPPAKAFTRALACALLFPSSHFIAACCSWQRLGSLTSSSSCSWST